MSNTVTIYDPFLNKNVEISHKLTDRLRGKYACGPMLPNGEPEFGWRIHDVPNIQKEAADRIEQLELEKEALSEALSLAMQYVATDCEDCQSINELLDKAFPINQNKGN